MYISFGNQTFPVTADDVSDPSKLKFSFQQAFEEVSDSLSLEDATREIAELLDVTDFSLRDQLESLKVGPLESIINKVLLAQFFLTDLVVDVENSLYRVGVGVNFPAGQEPSLGPIKLNGFAIVVEKSGD